MVQIGSSDPQTLARCRRLDWRLPKHRVDIGGERCWPLRGVLRVTPARPVSSYISIGAFGKRHRPWPLRAVSPLSTATRLDRIYAVEPQPPAFAGPLARFSQADRMHRAQPHYAKPPVFFKTKDPALGAPLAHLQEKSAAITIQPSMACLAHRECRQFPNQPGLPRASETSAELILPIPVPILVMRTVADDGAWCKTMCSINPNIGVDFFVRRHSCSSEFGGHPLRHPPLIAYRLSNLIDFKRFSFRSVHPIGTPPEWKTCPDNPASGSVAPANSCG